MKKRILFLAALMIWPVMAYASQNSIIIPTTGVLSGVAAMTAVNAATNTLASNFSGTSAPSPIVNYQTWIDTTTNPYPLQIYDGSNWVTIGTLDTSTHTFSTTPASEIYLGTTASIANPSIDSDVTTGLFTPAASSVAITTGGMQALTVNASQQVGIGDTFPNKSLVVEDSSSEQVNICNSSGGCIYLGFDNGSNFARMGSYNSGFQTLALNEAGAGSGFVSIGTSSAASMLNVYGSAAIGTSYVGIAAPANGLSIQGSVSIGSSAVTTGVALDLGSNVNSMLIPVGTTGQRPTGINGMLRYNSTRTSNETYLNGGWHDVSTGQIGIPSLSGNYYFPAISGTAGIVSTQNRAYCHLEKVPTQRVIDALATYVTTAGVGSTISFALYLPDGAGGRPGTPIVTTAPVASTSSAAAASSSAASPVTVSPGYYWGCSDSAWSTSAPSTTFLNTVNCQDYCGQQLGTSNLANMLSTASSQANFYVFFTATIVNAASWPTNPTVTELTGITGNPPMVAYHVQ